MGDIAGRLMNRGTRIASRVTELAAGAGDKLDEARKVLLVVDAGVRTFTGTDEAPSPIIQTLDDLGVGSSAGWELAQDIGLAASDGIKVVHDGLDDPAGLWTKLLAVGLGHFDEIKDDAEALQDRDT